MAFPMKPINIAEIVLVWSRAAGPRSPAARSTNPEFTGNSFVRNIPATSGAIVTTVTCSSNRESLRTVSGGSGLSFFSFLRKEPLYFSTFTPFQNATYPLIC